MVREACAAAEELYTAASAGFNVGFMSSKRSANALQPSLLTWKIKTSKTDILTDYYLSMAKPVLILGTNKIGDNKPRND